MHDRVNTVGHLAKRARKEMSGGPMPNLSCVLLALTGKVSGKHTDVWCYSLVHIFQQISLQLRNNVGLEVCLRGG